MWFLCFSVSLGSAEALVGWGGNTRYLLVAYFVCSNSVHLIRRYAGIGMPIPAYLRIKWYPNSWPSTCLATVDLGRKWRRAMPLMGVGPQCPMHSQKGCPVWVPNSGTHIYNSYHVHVYNIMHIQRVWGFFSILRYINVHITFNSLHDRSDSRANAYITHSPTVMAAVAD